MDDLLKGQRLASLCSEGAAGCDFFPHQSMGVTVCAVVSTEHRKFSLAYHKNWTGVCDDYKKETKAYFTHLFIHLFIIFDKTIIYLKPLT